MVLIKRTKTHPDLRWDVILVCHGGDVRVPRLAHRNAVSVVRLARSPYYACVLLVLPLGRRNERLVDGEQGLGHVPMPARAALRDEAPTRCRTAEGQS